ncbi:MAG: thiol-disulfide oxidoreductase DCC family protein [Synechococcaceae cyanobacterium]
MGSALAPTPETETPSSPGLGPQLTLLYDGGCPLCLREVSLLRRRDGRQGRLAFVDIDAPDYDASRHAGITYRQAMGRIHAIAADGTVLCDLDVFRRAYQLVDLGWLYAPTQWPLLRPLADAAYGFWARRRLGWTGRPELDQLCRDRQACGPHPPALSSPEASRP